MGGMNQFPECLHFLVHSCFSVGENFLYSLAGMVQKKGFLRLNSGIFKAMMIHAFHKIIPTQMSGNVLFPRLCQDIGDHLMFPITTCCAFRPVMKQGRSW